MITADSVKAKLQGLITKANETTGKSDADLTNAVNGLIEGYGKGESGGSGGGAIDLVNLEEVDSIDNPTASSPTAVKYNGEIYLLIKE